MAEQSKLTRSLGESPIGDVLPTSGDDARFGEDYEAEAFKRILSNLSQLAIGVAELRNQYGPDHGRTTPVVGLRPRHAHLAVGAATTYCRMLLETLAARSSA